MLLRLNRGFLDRQFYVATNKRTRFRRRFPLLDFCFLGNRSLADPNPWFSQRDYLAAHRSAAKCGPVLHFLLFSRNRPTGRGEALHRAALAAGLVPAALSEVSSAVASVPDPSPEDVVLDLWPDVKADLFDLRDVAGGATPTSEIQRRLVADRRRLPDAMVERYACAVIAAMPRDVRHLVLVPWLGVSGGSEVVTERVFAFLRQHYDGGLCIFSPDAMFDLPMAERARFGMPVVALNDIAPDLTLEQRIRVLDRVLIELRPGTVHCINSSVGWFTFRKNGKFYSPDTKIFVNIYSDIRLDEGVPTGFFWSFLPFMIDGLAGIIADNETVVGKARRYFGLTAPQMERFHVVRTPVLGLIGEHPPHRFRPVPEGPRPRRTLWMSRIAQEKRLDVLRAVAIAAPDRHFDIYGAILAVSQKVDLSWVDELPNVTYRGRFEDLASLPTDDYDSYIFTTSMEGMPISILEVALLGLPIVAPDVGGIAEFVGPQTGWLVSGPDAVDEYLAALKEIEANPDLARQRVEAARQRLVERHSWEAFSRSLLNLPGYVQPDVGHERQQSA